MNGRELLNALQSLSEYELSHLQVVTSDDPDDGFNFYVNNVEVMEVADLDTEDETVGPFIVLTP